MARRIQHYSGIGGQAVLEGVMMKNKETYAVAVRKPDGGIEVEADVYRGLMADSVASKIPFVRGVINFLDSMILGMRSLNFSASFYDEETERSEEDREKAGGQDKEAGKWDKLLYALTLILSLAFAISLFMLLPFALTEFLRTYVRNASLLAIAEGVLRILIFLIYIVAITAMRDIRRLYQYHGAEHKCINCLERGRVLTVDNVASSSRFHKRCGTSFVLLVLLISVILFFFIRTDNLMMRLFIRILLIPVIAGISYEIIRLAGRKSGGIIDLISLPGLWMQRLTTKEPDDDMIEVAIASVEAVFNWRQYLMDEFGMTEEQIDEETAG